MSAQFLENLFIVEFIPAESHANSPTIPLRTQGRTDILVRKMRDEKRRVR